MCPILKMTTYDTGIFMPLLNNRFIVDTKGGISKLSELTGIPQPSLSRFFYSASMPKRITLLKIAKALNLSQVEIATEWVR